MTIGNIHKWRHAKLNFLALPSPLCHASMPQVDEKHWPVGFEPLTLGRLAVCVSSRSTYPAAVIQAASLLLNWDAIKA